MTWLQGGSAPQHIKDVAEPKFIILPRARHTDPPALYTKQHTHTQHKCKTCKTNPHFEALSLNFIPAPPNLWTYFYQRDSVFMTFHERSEEIGQGGQIRRARACEMSPDMEAEAEKRRCRANSDDTAKQGKKGQAFTVCCSLSISDLFPPPHSSLKWHQQLQRSTFPVCAATSVAACLCGHRLIPLPVSTAALPVSLSHYYDDLDDKAAVQTTSFSFYLSCTGLNTCQS